MNSIKNKKKTKNIKPDFKKLKEIEFKKPDFKKLKEINYRKPIEKTSSLFKDESIRSIFDFIITKILKTKLISITAIFYLILPFIIIIIDAFVHGILEYSYIYLITTVSINFLILFLLTTRIFVQFKSDLTDTVLYTKPISRNKILYLKLLIIGSFQLILSLIQATFFYLWLV